MRHYTIPFFIPHKGCPFACIFCQQRKISGCLKSPSVADIKKTARAYLKTMPDAGVCIEVGFFGGSFTAIPYDRQGLYLEAIQPFIKRGKVQSIRISTRPDFINQKILNTLKRYGVRHIELGVQSAFDDILEYAKRGHSISDVRRASSLILKNGFVLGHQMMVGLPKSSFSREIETAAAIADMGAQEVRIYPVVVIKGTELAQMWHDGVYKPLKEEDAVKRCGTLISFFEKKNIKILRCGLHPSEGLLSGADIIEGPFHQAFGQKVRSYMCGEKLARFFEKEPAPNNIEKILFNSEDAPYVFGYRRENAKYAENMINSARVFFKDTGVSPGKLRIIYKNKKIKTIKAYI